MQRMVRDWAKLPVGRRYRSALIQGVGETTGSVAGSVLQLNELPTATGGIKAHSHGFDTGASLEDGDAVHNTGDVFLDMDAP